MLIICGGQEIASEIPTVGLGVNFQVEVTGKVLPVPVLPQATTGSDCQWPGTGSLSLPLTRSHVPGASTVTPAVTAEAPLAP